jgi:hypothetical protein
MASSPDGRLRFDSASATVSAMRRGAVTGCAGFLVGLVIGTVSLLGCYLRNAEPGERWIPITPEFALLLLVSSLPAAVNGTIGAFISQRRGTKRVSTVTYLPASLHLIVFVVGGIVEPQSGIGLQLYTLMFSLVAWIAGRLGQELGWWSHRRSARSDVA